MATTQRIGFVVFPEFQVIGFAAITVFEIANKVVGDVAYAVSLLSEKGGPVRSTAGFDVETAAFEEAAFETLILGAGMTIPVATPGLSSFLKQSARKSRRIAALCAGSFILAEAGILSGKRATTHWMFTQKLRAEFPDVQVEEDQVFVNDGAIWTSAGMTACIDLSLALVEEDHGREIAQSVARRFMVHHRRAGGQSLFSTLLELEPKSDRIQKTIAFASQNLRNELSVPELAEVAGLSPRQFSRTFSSETGQSPAKAVEGLRVEAARVMMERGRHSMDVVARETGFSDRAHMRRAFLRSFGQAPNSVHRSARPAQRSDQMSSRNFAQS